MSVYMSYTQTVALKKFLELFFFFPSYVKTTEMPIPCAPYSEISGYSIQALFRDKPNF